MIPIHMDVLNVLNLKGEAGMTTNKVKGHGASRALAGFVIAGALALFLSAPPVHAQSATISAGTTDPSISGIGTMTMT